MRRYPKETFIYSKAKAQAEQVVRQKSHNYVILRPGEIYDENDDKMITAQNILDYMTQPAFAIDGGVSVTSRPAVAKAIVRAAETPLSNKLYSLGGENITIGELARITQELCGKGHIYLELPYDFAMFAIKLLSRLHIKIMEEEAVKYGGFYWFMDSSAAKEELGYEVQDAR